MVCIEESVNKAFVRLKGKTEVKHANFKKNVRKSAGGKDAAAAAGQKSASAPGEPESKKQFERLAELAGKLLDLGDPSMDCATDFDVDIYTDSKETLEEEIRQLKAEVAGKSSAAPKMK